MSYTSDVPQANQSGAQTQSIINANFMALAPWGNGYGIFSLQSTAPSSMIIGSNNDAMYTLTNGTTGQSEMYVHIQNQAGTVDIPFTASVMSNTATDSCVNGWSYLPSGLLIKWGSYQASSGAINTIDVGSISGGPNYNKVFTTYLTPFWNAGTVTASPSIPVLVAQGTTSAGNFTSFVTNYNATYSYATYMVIGV